MDTHHLNQIDLARRWKMSGRTLERWRWLGQGPSYIKLGGRVVYRLEDIMEFEREQIRAGTRVCTHIHGIDTARAFPESARKGDALGRGIAAAPLVAAKAAPLVAAKGGK